MGFRRRASVRAESAAAGNTSPCVRRSVSAPASMTVSRSQNSTCGWNRPTSASRCGGASASIARPWRLGRDRCAQRRAVARERGFIRAGPGRRRHARDDVLDAVGVDHREHVVCTVRLAEPDLGKGRAVADELGVSLARIRPEVGERRLGQLAASRRRDGRDEFVESTRRGVFVEHDDAGSGHVSAPRR